MTLESDYRELLGEKNALLDKNKELAEKLEELTIGYDVEQLTDYVCIYCGGRYGPVTLKAMKAHVNDCEKHPMRALEAKNKELQEALHELQVAKQVAKDRHELDIEDLEAKNKELHKHLRHMVDLLNSYKSEGDFGRDEWEDIQDAEQLLVEGGDWCES